MKKGFTSLYLVMILAVLMLLFLSVSEAAAGYGARAAADNISNAAGRSVLSEYGSDLFSDYGVFALRAYDFELTELLRFFIEKSCEGSGVLKLKLGNCEVNTEKYPALDINIFGEQISKLGAGLVGKKLSDILKVSSKVSSKLSDFKEKKEMCDEDFKEFAKKEDVKEEGDKPENASDLKAKKKARELMESYKEAENPDLDDVHIRKEERCIPRGLLQNLPTRLLEIESSPFALFSGGIFQVGAESFLQGSYITSFCSNALKKEDGGVLSCEAEYILYGYDSDGKNAAAAKRSLYALRFMVNSAAVFSDSEKTSEISAAAAAIPFLPFRTAFFALCFIEAGNSAKKDLEDLYAGKTASLIPDVPAFGSYEDHMLLLLSALSKEKRLSRLMDIMQLNISRKSDFSFQDYAYGFDMRAEFLKSSRNYRFIGVDEERKGLVQKTFLYE